MEVSEHRFNAAKEAYLTRIDEPGFAIAIGMRQEIHLRTDMKDDLHGAFTVAVEEHLKAGVRNW